MGFLQCSRSTDDVYLVDRIYLSRALEGGCEVTIFVARSQKFQPKFEVKVKTQKYCEVIKFEILNDEVIKF